MVDEALGLKLCQYPKLFDQPDFRVDILPWADWSEDPEMIDAREEQGTFRIISFRRHPKCASSLGCAFGQKHGRHKWAVGKMVSKKRSVGIQGLPCTARSHSGSFEPINEAEAWTVGGESAFHGVQKRFSASFVLRSGWENKNCIVAP